MHYNGKLFPKWRYNDSKSRMKISDRISDSKNQLLS